MKVPSNPKYSMVCNNDDSFLNFYTDFMALCAFNLYVLKLATENGEIGQVMYNGKMSKTRYVSSV